MILLIELRHFRFRELGWADQTNVYGQAFNELRLQFVVEYGQANRPSILRTTLCKRCN